MVVWLTKYALSQGIFQISGGYSVDGKYFRGKSLDGDRGFFCRQTEVFSSKDDAERDFYARRYKKIKSVEKQLIKLEKQKPKFIE